MCHIKLVNIKFVPFLQEVILVFCGPKRSLNFRQGWSGGRVSESRERGSGVDYVCSGFSPIIGILCDLSY